MSVCIICKNSSLHVVSLCSHEEHIVCLPCYCNEQYCRVCPIRPNIIHDDIVLKQGRYHHPKLCSYTYECAKDLGIIECLDNPNADGYYENKDIKYQMMLNPIETIIETEEGYRMNLLQYAILEEYIDMDDKHMANNRSLMQAYESLIYGLNKGIEDIVSLYHTYKYPSMPEPNIIHEEDLLYIRTVSLVDMIKKYYNHRVHIDTIYYQCQYWEGKEYVHKCLSYALKCGWLIKDEDYYMWNA